MSGGKGTHGFEQTHGAALQQQQFTGLTGFSGLTGLELQD
jgi:hypothetical protein